LEAVDCTLFEGVTPQFDWREWGRSRKVPRDSEPARDSSALSHYYKYWALYCCVKFL